MEFLKQPHNKNSRKFHSQLSVKFRYSTELDAKLPKRCPRHLELNFFLEAYPIAKESGIENTREKFMGIFHSISKEFPWIYRGFFVWNTSVEFSRI